jgi:hypothetical protein
MESSEFGVVVLPSVHFTPRLGGLDAYQRRRAPSIKVGAFEEGSGASHRHRAAANPIRSMKTARRSREEREGAMNFVTFA